jgi:pilus assembly protein FimV
MRWASLHTLGGLCVVFLAACGDGGAAPSDGSPPVDAGAAGTTGAAGTSGGAGTTGAAGATGGAGATGAAGTTGGAAGTGGGPAPTGGAVGTGGAAGTGATALSFAADIWPVFDKTRDPVFVYRGMGSYSGCSTPTSPCHGSANPGARFSMSDASTAYAALLGVSSTSGLCNTAGATTRVIPGDPDRSCLVRFYVGRLKDDLQWVDQAEIDLVRRWIAEGARP